MREPPPVDKPSSERFSYLIRGLIMLVIGMVAEGFSRPVVPWSYVPGQLAVVVGVGIALGILELYYPRVISVVYLVVAAGVFWFVFGSDTSILPLFLYASAYDLTRFGASWQEPSA